MKAIAIYAEGGGDHPGPELRLGFDTLLRAQKEAARARRLRWSMVLCGERKATCDAFLDAVRTAPEVVNVLLVDSKNPLRRRPVMRRRMPRRGVSTLRHVTAGTWMPWMPNAST